MTWNLSTHFWIGGYLVKHMFVVHVLSDFVTSNSSRQIKKYLRFFRNQAKKVKYIKKKVILTQLSIAFFVEINFFFIFCYEI